MEETIGFLLSVWALVTGALRAVCVWLWNLRWWQFWLLVAALAGAWIVYMTSKRRKEEARAQQRREKVKRYWPTSPLAGPSEAEHKRDNGHTPPSQKSSRRPQKH